ncbi:hypothetical protein MKW92_049591 [Papaver armeniacum]|nr:hypothetical protein MKW92_049591 [Papaver armeniacum]
MTSLKQFSFSALIFSFILASSFADAARTINAVVPQGDWSCQFLSDVPTSCTNNKECADQCERHKFHKGGSCLVIPFVPDQTPHCCCYN